MTFCRTLAILNLFFYLSSAFIRECKITEKGWEYMGTVSQTRDGIPCQPWSDQYPQPHDFTDPLQFPDRNIEAIGNGCRNPDGSDGPWCYTNDKNIRWGYCDVPTCSPFQECKNTGTGGDYRGSQAITKSGQRCKRWSDLSGQERRWLNNVPGAEDENFCRNPDDRSSGPWCFVEGHWNVAEDCGVKWCKPTMMCTKDKAGRDYVGSVSVTHTGRKCQRWSRQSPHSHDMIANFMFPDDTVQNAENFCRNPDNANAPWCYTEDPDVRWEYCDIPVCQDCRMDELGIHYAGTQAKSRSGIPCQAWASQTPHPHTMTGNDIFPEVDELQARNYCRNPDRSPDGPWCYLDDTKFQTREPCDVPLCSDQPETPKRHVKHVLHLGVDGLKPACIPGASKAPNIRTRLGDAGASTYTLAKTVLPPISGPGWTTTLCGSEPESHGVLTNSWKAPWFGHDVEIHPVTPAGMEFPCVFDVIKSQDPNVRTAMFYGWNFFGQIGNEGHPGAVDKEYLYNYKWDGHFKSDDMVAENARKYLKEVLQSAELSYTFVYFLAVDCTGHAKGWCTNDYTKAITGVDRHIGTLLDIIDELGMTDEVLVMLSADHGGAGKDHYIPLDEDVNIPMFLRGPGIKKGHDIDIPVSNSDMAPTALHMMGLQTSPYWTGSVMKDLMEETN